MDDNAKNFDLNKLYLETIVYDYDCIVSDHEKLQEVKDNKDSIIQLEENNTRIENRIARENTTYKKAIERINNTDDFVDINILQKIINISKSVCRILKNGRPVGTGFLISSNVVITNNHVISSPEDCKNMAVQFNYELNMFDKIGDTQIFNFDPESFFITSSIDEKKDEPLSGLDFTMVTLEIINEQKDKIVDIPSLELDKNLGKIIKGESCIIIQHPNGLPKKTTLNNNSFFSETDTQLIYETDTLPGSSGSLVLALGTCEVIALHQRGIPKMDSNGNVITKSGKIADNSTTDEEIDWLGNAGIKISKILEAVKKTNLPDSQKDKKNQILRKSVENKKILNNAKAELPNAKVAKSDASKQKNEQKNTDDSKNEIPVKPIDDEKKPFVTIDKPENMSQYNKTPFLILAKNNLKIIHEIETDLENNYGDNFDFFLSMPLTAESDKDEIFVLQISTEGENPNEFARELLTIPNIKYAEYDDEIFMNSGVEKLQKFEAKESLGGKEDTSTESYFLNTYGTKSKYVKGKTPQQYRQWNWEACNYDGSVKDIIGDSIKIFQFDTGYVIHPKIIGSFDLENDFDFVNNDDNSHDDGDKKFTVADFGHGGRTGSLVVGNQNASSLPNNGNCGFLAQNKVKLIPYRVAKDVIILGRQAELAAAVDMALANNAKVITTSLGLPPTMVTYNLAKKVYNNGVIWCCAAGNEVKEVVAPAVHEGTIAVAASNPLDEEWKGSSHGKEVDITAPGMHVYVPRFNDGGKFSMSYGHGTSYATPQVASAAVLWLYKNRVALAGYNGFQIVEAFRESLKNSARKIPALPNGFGAGILNINQLLKEKLPAKSTLKYRYLNKNESEILAGFKTVTESLKMIWNGLMRTGRKIFSNEKSMEETEELSKHAQKVIRQNSPQKITTSESMNNLQDEDAEELYNILRRKVIK